MKNLFKPEDFKDIDVAVSSANRIFLFNQVLEIVNVKLNKLIEASQTVINLINLKVRNEYE